MILSSKAAYVRYSVLIWDMVREGQFPQSHLLVPLKNKHLNRLFSPLVPVGSDASRSSSHGMLWVILPVVNDAEASLLMEKPVKTAEMEEA